MSAHIVLADDNGLQGASTALDACKTFDLCAMLLESGYPVRVPNDGSLREQGQGLRCDHAANQQTRRAAHVEADGARLGVNPKLSIDSRQRHSHISPPY